MKYAIKSKDGFMCYDEDRIGEYSYDPDIDEHTFTFDTKEDAERQCGFGDEVVAI